MGGYDGRLTQADLYNLLYILFAWLKLPKFFMYSMFMFGMNLNRQS